VAKRRLPTGEFIQTLLTSLNRHHELAKIHEAYGRLDSAIAQLKEALTIAKTSLCDGHKKTKEVKEDLDGVTLMENELLEDAMASTLE
jgi:hypothetical protein